MVQDAQESERSIARQSRIVNLVPAETLPKSPKFAIFAFWHKIRYIASPSWESLRGSNVKKGELLFFRCGESDRWKLKVSIGVSG